MNFDSQKKIISENNPIDFIEEYVINEDKAIYRDSRDEITIFSNGIWKKYDVSFKWDNERKIIEINSYFDMSKKKKRKIQSIL